MIRKIIILIILVELGVIGWIFNELKNEEASPSNEVQIDESVLQKHGPLNETADSVLQHGELNLEEQVNPSETIELLKSFIPILYKEFQQFSEIQKEVIDTEVLEELEKIQLEDLNQIDFANDGFQEVISRIMEDPSNSESINEIYNWFKNELEQNKMKMNEMIEQEDEFKEERVIDIY